MIAYVLSRLFSSDTLKKALNLKASIFHVSVMTEADLLQMEKDHEAIQQAESAGQCVPSNSERRLH